MLGWFRRHRKIRNGALYFLVSCLYCLPDDFFRSLGTIADCGMSARYCRYEVCVTWSPWAQIKLI